MTKQGKKKAGPYHHGNLREALVTRAIEILEAEGASALSLRRVARDTGVSQAAPYSHFRDKEGLLTAVCVQGTQWFGGYMGREAEGKIGTEHLAGLALGYIRFALEHPELFQLMSRRPASASADDDGNLPAIFSEGYQMLVDGLTASPLHHFGPEQPQLDIPLAWGQVHGITNLLLEGRITPQDYGFDDLESFIAAIVNKFIQNFPNLDSNKTEFE